ncbi:WecB/TagA/CpsF family glycosyltransferase [Rossellomorea vietnamensis]|uniref:N-acetylglucosaminyldiphosphoundecaprenol N-acetyl-beta-D-mannosaminyltransferase n=1 Tax=Rossellomorea vietnamensis TaxID=218284 RepID=A0A5D4KH27_9BACI|nr:WecB/TagA/CpsF family glycosyltransferase [Rossellomorea vietnamensis]TYR76005.1 WecB/TagA/CpsF family glycosyltransferase [Rossellomorea vietnamensis]
MKFVDIMGVPFLHTDQKGFIRLLDERIQKQDKTFVVTANPEIVMKANEEPELMEIIQKATYVTADGIGVIKAAQLLNNPLPERVTGYDTMVELLSLSNQKNYSIYLLGAQEETLQKAQSNIKEKYPNLVIKGSHNGFFDWNTDTIASEIQSLQPDIIFVALGVPRQEEWISQNFAEFSHGVFIGVGGSFDVVAGTVPRAPEIWQKMNLEWFYRLVKQPSRWKRMLALPRFAVKVLKMKAKKQ